MDEDDVSAAAQPRLVVAPGSIVLVRDEEWLVTAAEETSDGLLVHVQGLTELVRDTTASFYASLDTIIALDPAAATVVADESPRYRSSRLWLEATVRKTPVPLYEPTLTVSTEGLADALSYQQSAVRRALSPDNLRPRILLADAVGLGKTLEIGMILSELVRRGRGERILVVTPRHVLEQMQHELWSRFALPFVRLDSAGIQRVRQKLPATRNPFTFYKRAIVSIDTLKSDRYLHSLAKQRWDAVVIDESHNITNTATQNNRLARTLARNTEALILASATPHNGQARLLRRAGAPARADRRHPEWRSARPGARAPRGPAPPPQRRGRRRRRQRLGRAPGAASRVRRSQPRRGRRCQRTRRDLAPPSVRSLAVPPATTPRSSHGRSPRRSCPPPRRSTSR